MLALAVPRAAAGIEISALEAILVDYQTGEVMFEKDADAPMTPSSMSKIMTVYKVFERLKDGRLQLSDSFAVSEKAWRKKGSKMFVAVNSRVKVEDLIRGIVVQSGNDASIVVAEGLAGSEDAFAAELNETARELGAETEALPWDWGRAVDPAAVEARLRQDTSGEIKAILRRAGGKTKVRGSASGANS